MKSKFEQKQVIEKVATDIPGLDGLLYGGLARGRSTLVTGRSGTAKSVLSLQLAHNLARRGIKTLMISVEEKPEDLASTAASLGFDLGSLGDRMTVIDLTKWNEGPTVFAGDFDLSGLVNTIEATVQEKGAQALVLDSATALFSPRPPIGMVRSLFYQLVAALRRLGLTSIITAEATEDYGSQLTALGVEDFVCDTVLILRNLVDDQRRRRSLEVHKYRRSRHYKGEYPFTITDRGVVVFPLDVTSEPELSGEDRFSSGVAGLDEITGGGFRRDSIVLLRGPTGSGKTTLAGMYARAGALRGEKVAYYGFEETRPILLRNFATMGMPLHELEAAGQLRIFCTYPEATSPEDLLIDIRSSLEQHKPSLIVLDSISSIEHSTSERGFRQFLVGLAALIREHSRSALMTQTVAHGAASEMTAPFLSTIPDSIVLLDYELEEEALARSIRVLKMRGSPHVSGRRAVQMGEGGLKVLESKPKRR